MQAYWQSFVLTNFAPASLQQFFNEALSNYLSNAETRSPLPSYSSLGDDELFYWWEDGAKKIFRGNELQDIKLVCRFRTYSDEDLPREILLTRRRPMLNVFFLKLHGGDRQAVDHLNEDQKVE